MNFNEFDKLLTEAVRKQKLYHSSPSWRNILEDGELTSSEMGWTERVVVKKAGISTERYGDRYISFARSPGSSFIKMQQSDLVVVFEFDAEYLRRKYKIVPVDWLHSSGSTHGRERGHSEMEERLITSKTEIQLAPVFTGMHVLWTGLGEMTRDMEQYQYTISQIRAMATDPDTNSVRNELRSRRLAEAERELAYIRTKIDNVYDDLLKRTAEFPNVPVWMYSNRKSFDQARWAEAQQINTRLEDPHDEDA